MSGKTIAILQFVAVTQAAGQFAGSAACSSCHAVQTKVHAASAHSTALSRMGEHPLRSRFPGASGEWAFGSGSQAVTFVSPVEPGFYLEHGLSYYTTLGKLDITPGHKNPSGQRYRVFDPGAAILKCFQCHSTGTLSTGEGDRIQPSEVGVRCEACHGPGADHARTQAASAIRNPKRLTAAQLNDACGACHRMPAAAGQFVDWSDPWNARHQPLSLARAKCFTKSNGALSCLTCHDAHGPLSRDAEAYDRTCTGCHAKVEHRAVVAGKSCTSCHMPKVEPRQGLRFANHWIGVFSASDSVRPVARR